MIKTEVYEEISARADPMYANVLRATETVKAFIANRGCVIYGGTAIDYALRLRGSMIYDDSKLAVPDLDFYSRQSAEDAYDLAEILYNDGHEEARARPAVHSTTMRVDAGQNHWVADVSYMPPALLEMIPTVTYTGMQCVHPDFQRIDLHSSLTFPYDNAPAEVIFARWGKDVQRLRLLDEIYPIAPPPAAVVLPRPTTRPKLPNPLGGWGAYSVLIAASIAGGAVIDGKTELPAAFHVTSNAYSWSTPIGRGSEYWSDKINATHAGWASFAPPREERTDGVTLLSSEDRLLSVVHVPIGGEDVLSVCVNGVLMYMLGEWFIHKSVEALVAYRTLWRVADETDLPFLKLSAEVYGSRNINTAQQIAIQRAVDPGAQAAVPKIWQPGKGKEKPKFAYTDAIWRQDGSLIA